MLQVALRDVEFFGPIGFFPEEKILGNSFLVDLCVTLSKDEKGGFPFLDYALLFSILKKEFSEPEDYLETLAQRIMETIKSQFNFIEKVNLKIKKKHPPLEGVVGCSEIILEA